MSLEAAGALLIYRHLLKAIRKHIGVDGSKAHFKSYVSGEDRKNQNLNDPERIHLSGQQRATSQGMRPG